MILGKIDHITMASNADANKYTQSSLREPDIADKQWEDSVDVYQNDEQFDGKDLDKGVDLGDEIEQEFVKGLNAESQEETCSELKAKQESGTDEDSIYKFLVEDDEGEIKIPLEGNVEDKTLESEEPFEEIEEWEEVTEEELSDNEEMEDTEEEDESDDEEGDEEEEGAEDGAEEDMSTKGQSQLGACAYESDEDLEKCYICLAGIRDQDFGTPESCDHTFCLECILEWSKHVNTCPVDRTLFHCILVRYTLGGQIERTIQVETSNKQEEEQEDSVTYCEVCGCCDREDRLLLCDGCDNGYHCECLDPPLEFIPIEEWYCPECATVELSCQQSVVQQDDEEDNCEDISEEEEKPVTRQQRSVAKENRASQSLRATRAIARTQVSERVMARISEVRAQRQLEQGTVGASSSVFSKKYTPKKRKKKQRKKRKKRVKRKVKGRKVKGKKVKKKVKATRPATVKTRIAGKLGLVKARSGSLLPDRKAHLEPSLDNQRAGIGAAKLNIFGWNDLTEISFDDGQSDNQWASKPNTSQLLPRIKSPSVNTSSSVDLLSSIMQEQKLLHTKSGNVTIHRDGSLSASPAAKESSQQKRRKFSISLEGDYLKPSSGSLTRSPDEFQSSYYIHSTDDTKVKVESHETLEPETSVVATISKSADDDWKNVEKKKVDFDNTNEGNQDREMKQLNIREAKGKRAAARELANQRAVEREEEVKNMRERRQEEEEFNDEMVWNIQTPFSVTQKSKDESKIKDSNVNGTKNIEEESKWEEATWEEATWEEATWEEEKWEEAVQKKEEAVQKKKEEHIKEDNHEKTAPIEHDGKEQGEGTLTCRASTSSFESHSETEERDMRKSIDDKRRRGNRHGKRKRSHLSNTSGSGPDSSAEEGEVKSDDESKGQKTTKKKTKKSKHNRDRDTRNVVVNDHQPISDLPKIPKLKHDSRRVEDRERYERGSGYNDLRHVIQVKRSYENPRYEMYWDEYSRRWVEYRPDWTAAWEQHRTYEQQLYAADWGRQNSGNSHRYLKERSWENFTVKRERSPIFDRRKSRERSNLDKRDIGWEATTERDRRNRGTRDKDRKESRHDHKQGGHTTTRSNSSGTDSQRRERSQDKSRDKDHKEKSKNDNPSNEKNFVRSSRTNGRDKHGRFNETSEKQKSDHHGNKSKERKSRDSVKSEKTATGGKIIEKNDRLKTSAENRKAEEKGKERTKENIDLIAKSTKTDSLEKKKKKKEKQVKVKGKKEKKEKEKKVKKKKDEVIILPDVKETLRMEKEEDLEKKPIIDKPRTNDTSEKHEESSMKAKIDAPCKNTNVKSGPAEIKDDVSSLKNIIKKSNDRTSNSQRISTHTTELDKRTKEPMRAFQETVKVDEPYDPFEPTASPSISNSSPCSPFQALSPPPSSKRKLSSDLDSLNNSTDSAFGGLKHKKIETVKPLPDVKTSKPLTKPFNDILPQLATQDGSKLNQLIDKFVNKSGKATLDSKETDAEKALPGSSKFATSAKKSIIFNAPSPNESDSEFDFNNDDEEIESSAVELQNKNSRERYLKKLHHQERVVEEVKLAIKPYYQRKEIDKHDYKEILKRSVNQVCHSKSGEINPVKIRRLIDGYVKKFQLKKKHVEKGGKEKKKPSSLAELKKKR